MNSETFLSLDLETTGLPKKPSFHNYHPYTFLEAYDDARVVQIGCALYNAGGSIVESHEWIVRPAEGVRIENGHIHGIQHDAAVAYGADLTDIVTTLARLVRRCTRLIAHNADFDRHVLCAELYRNEMPGLAAEIFRKEAACTMKTGCDITRIPRARGYKYPTLAELYRFLFDESFEGAHTALGDAQACGRCYFAMLPLQLTLASSQSDAVSSVPEVSSSSSE